MYRIQNALLLVLLFTFPLVFASAQAGQEYVWSKTLFTGLVLCGLFATFILPQNGGPGRYERLTVSLVVLLISAVLSAAFAVNRFKSLEVIALWIVGLALYRAVLTSRMAVGTQLWALFAAAAVVSLYGLLQWSEMAALPRTQYGEADPASTLGLANFASEFLLPLIPLLALTAARRRGLERLLSGVVLALALGYIAVGQTRAAFVGLAAAGLVTVPLLWKQIARSAVPGALAALAPLLFIAAMKIGATSPSIPDVAAQPSAAKLSGSSSGVVALVSNTAESRTPGWMDDPSVVARIESWKAALEIFRRFPLLGAGPGNFEIQAPRFASTRLQTLLLESNTKMTAPHNEFLQFLCEQGLVGTAALGLVLVSTALALRRLAPGPERVAWTAAAVALLTASSFAFPFHLPGSVFCTLALSALLVRSSRHDESVPSQRPVRQRVVAAVWLVLLAGSTWFSSRVLLSTLRYYQGVQQINERRWEEGAAALSDSARLYPGQDAAFYNQAYIYYHLNRKEEGLRAIEFSLRRTPYLERALDLRQQLQLLP
ncbi:MAG: O-antigen ligase family protein [Acidobacteriota bacterium]